MNEERAVELQSEGKPLDELHMFLRKLLARPLCGGSGQRIKVLGFGELDRGLVMIAEQDVFGRFPYELDALVGVRPVSDQIAEADDGIDILLRDDLKRLLERQEVGVDIRKYGQPHRCEKSVKGGREIGVRLQ